MHACFYEERERRTVCTGREKLSMYTCLYEERKRGEYGCMCASEE